MDSSPLVSVLMTVYNRDKYIADAIDSVLASTYQKWELIIVDDCSVDKSVEIAEDYCKKDKRIRVFLNEKNLGDYPNRNKAASYAKGKYLKYLDADDLLYAHGLEQLVFYMEQFPLAGYGLCSLNQDKKQIYPFQLSPEEAYLRHYLETPLFHKAPLSSIIKSDAFFSVNGFSGKQHVGDFEMWNRLSQKFHVVLMPKGIAWYREHDDQQMHANRTDPFVPFKYTVLAKNLIRHKDSPLDKNSSTKVLDNLLKKESKEILSAAKHHSFNKAVELFRYSDLSLFSVIKNGLF